MQLIDLIHLTIYATILYCSIVWFTVFFSNRKKIFKNPKLKRFHSITFLVPAYNEEKNIRRCLDTLLNLNYPKEKLKIFVIDDGSTDNTVRIVKKYKNVRLIKQKNSGKAVALNNSLKFVKTDYVACMDADSFPDKNYLLNLLGYLEKKNVVSATPAIKVIETNSWIGKIQWVEYLFAVFLRKVFSMFECEYVVPGPGGVYKTSVLKKLGGWDENNLTEDMEISFRIRKNGYRISNSVNAFVYTVIPKDFKGLWKQRIRWYRGYLQNVRKYYRMIANPKYGNFGFFFLPINFAWMFILGFLFFSQIYGLVTSAITSLINWSYIDYAILPISIDIINFDFYTLFKFVFIVTGLLAIWLSVTVSKEKINLKKRTSSYLLFIFIYPILISIYWIVSILYDLLGIRRKW